MNRERFLDRFAGPMPVIVHPAGGGPPYRIDGKPLTEADRAVLEGRDEMDLIHDGERSPGAGRVFPEGPPAE